MINKSLLLKGNLLIAGSKGLIGSAIIRYLENYKCKKFFCPTRQELDLLNKEDFLKYCFFNDIRHMIFAAGKVGGILDNKNNQVNYLFNNTQLALNALQVSIEANLEKVVLFGSSCMYPSNATQPYKEKDLLSGPIEKTSMGYAISKILLTQSAGLINENVSSNPFFITVIPNSTYGPNDNFDPDSSHVLAALINKIYNAKLRNLKKISLFGTGKPLREFIHSDDVANAVFFLLNNVKNKPTFPINIGTSEEITIKNLAIEVSKILNYTGDINFDLNTLDGAKRKILDNSTVKSMGWSHKINLKTGLIDTIDWYINKEKLNNNFFKT